MEDRKPSRHPVDTLGLPLPEPSWPDRPGSAGDLEPVRRFCNTLNREAGADAWRSTSELDEWLVQEGYDTAPCTSADLVRARSLREAIWQSIGQHSLLPLRESLRGVVAAISIAANGDLELHATAGPIDEVTIRLAIVIRDAARAGTWTRLKTCAHCGWVFHDTSKNRSGRWCSMQACGGREKAKAYRRRRSMQ